ncbi:MAG: metal-dependent hydrolase [Desulfovibrio sp.]|jgi:inner membrane protein|nr:metal-dependent hydrolase [Desulfovibrio sp.]
MDPVTHAVSGAVAMLAMPNRPATRWAVPLAALAAASPDIDVIFAVDPLRVLQLHRGITHSLAAMPALGLLLTLCFCPLWRAGMPGRWSFCRVWAFACAMLGLHIWLDVVTTYGTMLFLPFSHERVRLNALFIVDLLFVVPLILAIWRGRTRRVCMVAAALWLFAYPAMNIALNARHAAVTEARLLSAGRAVSHVTILPDAFAPFFWRAIFLEQAPEASSRGKEVCEQSLDMFGQPRSPEIRHPAFPDAAIDALSRQSVFCREFFAFTLLPVVSPLPPAQQPQNALPGMNYSVVYDVRFGTGLKVVRSLLQMRHDGEHPFRLMLAITPDSGEAIAPYAVRLERLYFSGSNKDSGWQIPTVPQTSSVWRRLVGLR